MKDKKVQALILAVFGFALAIGYVSIAPAYAHHHCFIEVGLPYDCGLDHDDEYYCTRTPTTKHYGCGPGAPE